jgi:sugar (pentulose or hexulose) kinase
VPTSHPTHRGDEHYLGIDLGTSGIRAILIDEHEHILASARTTLPPPVQQGTAVEQDPGLWWAGVVKVLESLRQQVPLQTVRAITIDGTSGTVLLTDAQGQPLHAALMYNDSRARAQLCTLRELAPAEGPVHSASSGLAKCLWLSEQPYAARAVHLLHQADWIAGKLAGRYGFSDPNNCIKTGYDARHNRWPVWLEQLPLPRDWLPSVYPQATPICSINPGMAEQFGISSQAQIISGTTDSTAAFVATGASQIGEAVTSLGSTLVLKIIAATPVVNMHYGIYSQPLGKYWLVGGASNSGGAVLQHFFSEAQMAQLESRLQPETPTGLDYYPLLARGERFPINDPELAPQISPRPPADWQFFQGLLEGLAAIELTGYQRLAECGAPWPSSVRTTGGGARNSAWTQIRARLLNVPLLTADHSEAAFGSARLARQALTTRRSSP